MSILTPKERARLQALHSQLADQVTLASGGRVDGSQAHVTPDRMLAAYRDRGAASLPMATGAADRSAPLLEAVTADIVHLARYTRYHLETSTPS